jgi:hypothetical protein
VGGLEGWPGAVMNRRRRSSGQDGAATHRPQAGKTVLELLVPEGGAARRRRSRKRLYKEDGSVSRLRI